jgi:hypothetical protein
LLRAGEKFRQQQQEHGNNNTGDRHNQTMSAIFLCRNQRVFDFLEPDKPRAQGVTAFIQGTTVQR